MRRLMWLGAALAVTSGALLLGCQQPNDPIDGSPDSNGHVCIDNDGDGFGVFCSGGLDCNDHDPTVGRVCGDHDPCAGGPASGCPCDEAGAVAECRTAEPVESPDGTLLCYAGTMTCEEGEWGECLGLEPYDPPADPHEAGSGANRQAVVTGPTACAGCDPGCNQFHYCPASPDLAAPHGINVMYDVVNLPVAVVTLDPSADGTFMWASEAVCDENGDSVPDYDRIPVWWCVSWAAADYITTPGATSVEVHVRTADTEPNLALQPWTKVADVPGDLSPPNPPQRNPSSEGNIYNALGGGSKVRQPWLEQKVTLHPAAGVSPRYKTVDIFFFCDEAS